MTKRSRVQDSGFSGWRRGWCRVCRSWGCVHSKDGALGQSALPCHPLAGRSRWDRREWGMRSVASIGAFLGLVFAAFAAEPAQLALELDAEGQREASAVEFRRLALEEDGAEIAGNWFWLAAYEYAREKNQDLSGRMLDRTEDATPFALAIPVSWLRAENAMQDKNWTAAAFHFDSLQLKVEDDAMREFAARGSAAAHLREKDLSGAAKSLAAAPRDLSAARKALEHYKGGRDKKPWLGGVLGMVPGLGYVYSGEYANGARSLILNSLFIWGMVETADEDQWAVFSVITFVEFTWYSGSIYGGIDAAHRHNQRRLDTAVNKVRGERRLRPDLSQVPLISLQFEF